MTNRQKQSLHCILGYYTLKYNIMVKKGKNTKNKNKKEDTCY